MKRTLALLTTIFLLSPGIASHASPAQKSSASAVYIIPSPPQVNAKAYAVMDAKTGTLVAQNNASQALAPASLTKLMSLYLVFDALKNGTVHLDDAVRISRRAWKASGSRMFIRVGTRVSVHDLILGIIVDSGNDATIALAEHIAGSVSSFVNMMNKQASTLGMSTSHFEDPVGMPHAEHKTSARDLAILSQALIQNFPEYYAFFSEKYFTYNHIRQPNRNRLLWRFKGADGLKTGHTSDAGYCLIASAQRGDQRFIVILLGENSDEDRAEDAMRLLTYAFRFFRTEHSLDANQVVTQAKVFKGKQTYINVVTHDDVFVTSPTGKRSKISSNVHLDTPLIAPIRMGQRVGYIDLIINGMPMGKHDLFAKENNELAGWWHRTVDSIMLHFHKG